MTQHHLALGQNASPAAPERAMWAALLLLALKDAAGKGLSNEAGGELIQEEARRWLGSDHARWICRALGLNAARLKTFIDDLRVRQQPKQRSDVGERIYRVRMEHCLSFRACADITGLAISTIYRIETDPEASASRGSWDAIYDFLGRYEDGDYCADNQCQLDMGRAGAGSLSECRAD